MMNLINILTIFVYLSLYIVSAEFGFGFESESEFDEQYANTKWNGIINYKQDITWNHQRALNDEHFKRNKREQPITSVTDSEIETLKRDRRLFGITFSDQCTQDLLLMNDYLSNKSHSESPMWQRQMLDVVGRWPSGVTNAHIIWSGDYYECTKLKVWRTNDNSSIIDRKPDIVGKYCLGTIGVILFATPLRAGLCVPHTCSGVQAQISATQSAYRLPFRVFVDDKFCQTEEAPAWDIVSLRIWWLFVILGSLVLLATIYDIFGNLNEWRQKRRMKMTIIDYQLHPRIKSNPSNWKQFVLSFSAWSNTRKIIDTSTSNENSHLGNIHGLKAITMSWVVMGHVCVMLNQLFAWKNGVDILEYLKVFWMQAIGGAEFSVDTFITITGFLLVFVCFKETIKNGRHFNPIVLYAHRLIRIWPPFALLIAYTVGISAHMPRGPISPAAFIDQDICRRVWWKALLFIQVYYGEKEKCLPHIWYLCIDMFFILISPIFLFPLLKKPRIGYAILSVMFICSIVTPFMLIHLHDLGTFPAINVPVKKREQFMHEVYDVPWGRIHCFIIGAVTGYLYYIKGKNLKLNKVFVIAMWLVVGSMMFWIVFGTLPYSSGRKPMLHNMRVFYGTFTRPLWSFGVSWIIFSCATGYGGVINSILSWKGFIPISRLSYSAYLVHFSVIGQYVASGKQPQMVDRYFMGFLIVSVFIVSLFYAWVMAIIVECPVIQLESLLMKIVLTKKKKQNEETKQTTIDEINQDHDQNLIVRNEPGVGFNLSTPMTMAHQGSLDNSFESDSEVFWDLTETIETKESKFLYNSA